MKISFPSYRQVMDFGEDALHCQLFAIRSLFCLGFFPSSTGYQWDNYTRSIRHIFMGLQSPADLFEVKKKTYFKPQDSVWKHSYMLLNLIHNIGHTFELYLQLGGPLLPFMREWIILADLSYVTMPLFLLSHHWKTSSLKTLAFHIADFVACYFETFVFLPDTLYNHSITTLKLLWVALHSFLVMKRFSPHLPLFSLGKFIYVPL